MSSNTKIKNNRVRTARLLKEILSKKDYQKIVPKSFKIDDSAKIHG